MRICGQQLLKHSGDAAAGKWWKCCSRVGKSTTATGKFKVQLLMRRCCDDCQRFFNFKSVVVGARNLFTPPAPFSLYFCLN